MKKICLLVVCAVAYSRQTAAVSVKVHTSRRFQRVPMDIGRQIEDACLKLRSRILRLCWSSRTCRQIAARIFP